MESKLMLSYDSSAYEILIQIVRVNAMQLTLFYQLLAAQMVSLTNQCEIYNSHSSLQ